MMNSIFKNIFPKTPSNFKKVIRETLNILPEKCDNKKVKVIKTANIKKVYISIILQNNIKNKRRRKNYRELYIFIRISYYRKAILKLNL